MATDEITTMMMFAGEAEAAIVFYTELFEDSGIEFIERYGPEHPGPEGQVVHARFHIGHTALMAMDSAVEQPFSFTPSMSFFVTCDTAEEVDRLFGALADGGQVLMPLDSYPFAQRYAWVSDRSGVSWQLTFR